MTGLNILHIVTVPWWNARSEYAIVIARCLKEKGHNVTVMGAANSPALKKAAAWALPIETSICFETLNPFKLLQSIVRLRTYIKRKSITIVNAHNAQNHVIAALACRKFPHVVLIRSLTDALQPRRHILNKYLHKALTQYFISCAQANTSRYIDILEIRPDKISLVYHAVDVHYYKPGTVGGTFRKKYNINADVLLVGMIARLSPIKGHEVFIKAASKVVQKIKTVRFVITGQESEISFKDLQKIIADYALEQYFIITGYTNDVRSVIDDLAMGVIASQGSEIICRIALEYMAMGKPVIGTKINIIPEIVQDNKTGFIVEPHNENELSDRIIQLLENRSLREQFGSAGRKDVERYYAYDRFTEKTEEIYNKALTN